MVLIKYLCLMVVLSLWGCQENQEHDASREATATQEISSEQKKDSIFITEIPKDSILIAQIISTKSYKDFIEPWRMPENRSEYDYLQITQKKIVPSGVIVESFSYGSAPCENFQISSFNKNGKIIQTLPLLLGCDCPSDCEGCAERKTIHWLDDTRFFIKQRDVIVLNTNEELASLDIDECDTKVIYTKKDFSITANGKIEYQQEEEIFEKQALLIDLQGKHHLSSISGFSGANTMYDYLQKGDTWIAEGSSIHQARREPFDIELDAEDISVLQGLQISVQKDLSVDVMVNDTSIISIPFNPGGMGIELSQKPEAYIMGVPDSLSPSTTLINDVLYLATKDEVEENILAPIDLVIGIADAYTLAYNVLENQFELTLFYADCCDNAIYLFKNQNIY
jgi:hypothetical protein